MGQKDSKVTVKECDLQKFGKVEQLIPEQPNQTVKIRANIQVNREEEDYRQWLQKMEKLKQSPQIAEFVVLPVSIQSNKCLACTNTQKKNLLAIYYEKINFSLSQVIKNRKYFKKYFTQTQIWYLLYVLIKVATFFEQKSEHIGNIHTTNVMLNVKSRIKVFTLFSSPAESQNLTRIKQLRHTDTYIAPEEIKFIHEDIMAINDCNRNKIDLFNIGLVLLSTVLLKDCYNIYTRTLFELNQQKLQVMIEEMKKSHLNVRYSLNLISIIQKFLIIDPQARKTPKYYLQLFKKYEGQILELEPFIFQLPADKINAEAISPEVCNYLQKVSPNTKQTKYLSLAKHLLQKNVSQESKIIQKQTGNANQKTKITRKLFNE